MKTQFKMPHTGTESHGSNRSAAFEEFDDTELYCATCRQAVPVRKKLLLVLPEGDKYEYLCAYCSGSVGTKLDRINPSSGIVW